MGFLFGLHQPAIKTEPPENLKWKILAPHIKKHFKLEKDVKEIAADLSLAAYKNYLKNKKKDK